MKATPPSDGRKRWVNLLLNRALKDPRLIRNQWRCRQPQFCLPFFDLCEATAYEEPERAEELAAAAIDLAERTGDRHLVHRSLGVEVNAAIALGQWDRADRLVESHENAAADCCPSCLIDHLHRRADLGLEHRRTTEAMDALKAAHAGLRQSPGDAAAGRVLNLRAIGHHFRGENGAAIEDAGRALRTMSLAGPQLFFRDAIGLMACFLRGGDDRRLDERVLDHLLLFERRLKGTFGWGKVRTRLSWVKGAVYVRLGDPRRGADRLERVRQALLKELDVPLVGSKGEPAGHGAQAPVYTDRETREVVAVTADLGQLRCRGSGSGAVEPMLSTCEHRLSLDPRLRRTLEETEYAVRRRPESALESLVELRSVVLVPVPGLLAENYLGPRRAAAVSQRRRPPSAPPLCFSPAAPPHK